MSLDIVPFQDIQPIQSDVREGNGMSISIYGIGTSSLFFILKDRQIKNIIHKDC
jgi:hypothetical protein